MALMKQRPASTLKLPLLQNMIKRDPESYKDDFLLQLKHFENELDIFRLRPTSESDRFTELVNFICHVSSCYPVDCEKIPLSLLELLETNANTLHPDVRAKLYQSLILLRNKELLDPLVLIKLSFRLFNVTDKALRLSVTEYIFNDIKKINLERKNNSLNRQVQTLLQTIITEDTSTTARKTVEILSELYRRRVWTDVRTVNIIGSACLNKSSRVMIAAVNFFLGIENKMLEDEDDEEKEGKKIVEVDHHLHSKKTKKRQRQAKKQVERNSKIRKSQNENNVVLPLFPAIQVINDPQSLAEKLFQKVKQSGERFEVKLLLLNFISRLIGCHQLLLLSFYSFCQKYLTSHQEKVTQVLAYLIQGCHEFIPPEELLPIVKAIAYNFITERCINEVIAVGINSIREIFARVPSILKEPDMSDFVQDLAMYGRKTHKSVATAAHSLVNLVRELYPALLRKSDRGKHHDPRALPASFGASKASTSVDGVDLLEAYERGEIDINSDDELIFPQAEKNKNGDENDDYDESDEEANDDDDDGGFEDEEEGEEEILGSEDQGSENEENESKSESEAELEELEIDDEMVEDDDDEEGTGKPGVRKEKLAKMNSNIRGRLDASRVLSNEDFQLIERLKKARHQMKKDPRSRANPIISGTPVSSAVTDMLDENDENVKNPYFAVDPESLEAGMRTGKMSKIERIKRVLAGRKDEKFDHGGHAGGLTNKEKMRKKNFMMVRKGKVSVAKKLNKSNSEVRYKRKHTREQMGRDKRKRRRT